MSVRRRTIEACLRRKGRVYRLANIVKAVGQEHRAAIRPAMSMLIRQGLVEVLSVLPREVEAIQDKKLRNLDNAGLEALLAPRRKSGSAWDRLWKAARILRDFTSNDLAEVAGATRANTQSFLHSYKQTGHFRSGRNSDRQVSWKLINDSGPKRPDSRG